MYLRVVFLLSACLAALAVPASGGERVTSIDLTGSIKSLWQPAANPEGDWPPQYAAAMLNYRHFARSINGEQSGGAYPMLPGSTNLNGLAWVWVAQDGSHIQRINRDLFRLFLRDRTSTFYRLIDCRALQWPSFTCSDGRDREMSAPSYARMIFGDRQFDRIFVPEVPDAARAE